MPSKNFLEGQIANLKNEIAIRDKRIIELTKERDLLKEELIDARKPKVKKVSE
ncbi:MAG: hypothetical protein WC220_11325 [Pedobacter sp.]